MVDSNLFMIIIIREDKLLTELKIIGDIYYPISLFFFFFVGVGGGVVG